MWSQEIGSSLATAWQFTGCWPKMRGILAVWHNKWPDPVTRHGQFTGYCRAVHWMLVYNAGQIGS